MAHTVDASLMELPEVGPLIDGVQSQPVIRGLSPAAGRRHAVRARSRRRPLGAVVTVKRSAPGIAAVRPGRVDALTWDWDAVRSRPDDPRRCEVGHPWFPQVLRPRGNG